MKFFSTVLFLLALVDLGTSVLMCYRCSDKNPGENGLCTTSKELSWSGCRTYFQPCVTVIDKNKKVEKVGSLGIGISVDFKNTVFQCKDMVLVVQKTG